MPPPLHDDGQIQVAIAGGGIAGLALAAGLTKKPHLSVHVYEAVAAFKDVGAGLALHMNTLRAMALNRPEVHQAYVDTALDIGDEDREMATEVILTHGPSQGELVAELGRAKGRKTVSRADLLTALLALIPPDRISFGKRLTAIDTFPSPFSPNDQPIRMTFADGSHAQADLLVRADGIHGVSRAFVLGPDNPTTLPKNHDGRQIFHTLVPSIFARKYINPRWTTTVPILIGPRGHINCIPLDKGTRLSAGVAVRHGPDINPSNFPATLDVAAYKDYSTDAREVVQLVARDPSASWNAADHDHAATYFRFVGAAIRDDKTSHRSSDCSKDSSDEIGLRRTGAVVLMGDATHASLPFAGNGAAQALEDAAVLDVLLDRCRNENDTIEDWDRDLRAACGAYDAIRRPRSQAVVELARRFGRVYAFADEEQLHRDPARLKAFFREAAAYTNGADVQGQNDAAVKEFEVRQKDLVSVTHNG